MKPGKVTVIVAAGLLVAGVFVLATRANRNAAAPGKAATQVAVNAAKPAPAADEKTAAGQPKPEVYFLDETGTNAPDDRLKANLMPKANGNKRLTGVRALTSADEGDFMAPRWSPDGLELMFSKAGYSGIYTKGLMGGGLTQVTGKDGTGFNAQWTHDGKILSKTNDGETQSFNPDGTPASSVSPMDDSNITGAFNADDTIYHRANPGEAPVPISTGEDRYYGGILSPDGKYVAYNGLETGIYVRPVDGSTPPVHIGNGTNPSFMPDSSGLVYNVTHDDGHNLVAGDLYMSSLDGQSVSNLTNGSASIETKPNVSPDGSMIAFESDGVIFIGSIQ